MGGRGSVLPGALFPSSNVSSAGYATSDESAASRPARARPARIILVSYVEIQTFFATAAVLLYRLDAQCLGERGEPVTLLLHAGGELSRCEDRYDLTGIAEPLGDDRILADFLEIRGNALAQFIGHVARPEYPANALECQCGIAGFRLCRNLGRARRALPAGHCQHLDTASLAQRLHHRKRCRQNMDATLAEVAPPLHAVAIGHLDDLQSHALQEPEQ